jgi:hypothetical protein
MEPSDIDGPVVNSGSFSFRPASVVINGPKGGETPGEMLLRLMADDPHEPYILAGMPGHEFVGSTVAECYVRGAIDLDAIASAFKAAVLKGEV